MKKYTLILLIFALFVGKVNAQKQGDALIDSVYNSFIKTKEDTNKIKKFQELAEGSEPINPRRALGFAKQGYALSEKLNWYKGMAQGLRATGKVYFALAKIDSAQYFTQKAYDLSEKNHDKLGSIIALNNLGTYFMSRSDFTTAIKYFVNSLKNAEEIKNRSLIAAANINIAVIFAQQRQFDKSRQYAKKSNALYKELKNDNLVAKSEEIIGVAYMMQRRFEQAIPYLLDALKIYEELGSDMGKAIIYTQLVACYTDKPFEQLGYLEKAQKIWERVSPEHPNAVATVGNLGNFYFDLVSKPEIAKQMPPSFSLSRNELLAKADEYLKKGLMLSKKIGNAELQSSFSKSYSKLCEYRGDYKGALASLKTYNSVQDSFYSQDIKNKIAAVEGERAIALKDKELKLSKLEMRQLWLYGVIIFILLIGIAFLFFNQSRIRRLRFKNELQKREADERSKSLEQLNKLSESELKAIRSQMNPHFIFNVLNSIESYIVENDSKTASRLVQKFASLSRLILENSTQSMVSADREWKALKLYTELEAMRFNNQFTYNFNVADDIELSDIMVPPMLIQPLIENSIHHGFRNSTAINGNLQISLSQSDNHIYFTVEDNGIGISEASKFSTFSTIKSKSIGLSSIKERIEIINLLNPESKASFEIINKDAAIASGTIAKLSLPKVVRVKE